MNIKIVMEPLRNFEFSTSKAFQDRRQFNKVLFTFPESQNRPVGTKFILGGG